MIFNMITDKDTIDIVNNKYKVQPPIDKISKKGVIPTNSYSLINKHGIVTQDIDTIQGIGQVKVNGEIWSAKTENDLKSPYGDFTEAYIVVIYNGRGYQYFWISNDTAGQGIKNVTPQDKLDEDLIESNIRDLDIIEKVETTGIGGRKNILILSTLGDWGEKKEATVDIDTDGNIVEETP